MELFRFAMLLLVQLSPIFIYANGEAVTEYKCANERTSSQSVTSASAELTNGCVLNGVDIKFDIKAMHEAAAGKTPKTPVVIDITDAAFTNSNINLIKAHLITGDSATQVPLLFTMSKTKITGTSMLEFGDVDMTFKLPPNSRIRIIDSELTISSAAVKTYVFIFHSLQLVTNSSMEISSNVITIEYKGTSDTTITTTAVFYSVSRATGMKISDKSSFTLQDNRITSNVRTGNFQYVWYQESSSLTISQNSIYTWVSNIINIGGHKKNAMYQAVWYIGRNSALTISDTSSYTLESNNISILGYDLKGDSSSLGQYVWWEDSNSPLTISQNSNYTWSMNSISMDGYDIKKMYQSVWYVSSTIAISVLSQFILDANRMLLQPRNYESIEYYLMQIFDTITGTISDSSSMVWKDNCVGMGHTKAGERNVFRGKWGITGDNSELLLDGNYITTTDKYGPSGIELTELVWGPKGYTEITISNAGKLNILNTKVLSNGRGATGSMLWNSSSSTYNTILKHPALEWSSSPAKDSDGSPIPTLDNTNLLQYMCVGLPGIPSRVTVTPTLIATVLNPIAPTKTKPVSPNVGPIPPVPPSPGKGDSNATLKANVTKTTDSVKSAAAILSAIPGVLITSVVFLCLYIW